MSAENMALTQTLIPHIYLFFSDILKNMIIFAQR